MASRSKALIPSAKDLALLSPQKVKLVMDAISQEGDRDLLFASLAMRCGTWSLLGCLAATCYLATIHEYSMAKIVLGAAVLSVIGKIVAQRLRALRPCVSGASNSRSTAALQNDNLRGFTDLR